MRRNKILILALSAICLMPAIGQNVTSLRGSNSITNDSKAPISKKWENNDVIKDRQFVQQPPLIPHKIENYQITRQSNKCFDCHSWENAKGANATKISLTHFKDRDGNELSTVSSSRYFCTQCHVPQKDAMPLIKNDYKPANKVK